MSGLIITTRSPGLLENWRQLLAGLLPIEPISDVPETLKREVLRAGARVWVSDAADERSHLPCHDDIVRVVIGQPFSQPFVALGRVALFTLSYEEAPAKLRENVKVAATLAAKNAALSALRERPQRAEHQPQWSEDEIEEIHDEWSDMETLVGHLGRLRELVAGCERLACARLGTMRALLFVRQENQFVAVKDEQVLNWGADSPMVHWFEQRSALLNLDAWSGDNDLLVESEIRRAMAQWRVKVLVPLLWQGELRGWLAVGRRADGSQHTAVTLGRAIVLSRLFSQLLGKNERLERAFMAEREATLAKQWLPSSRVLQRSECDDPSLPIAVRGALGDVLHFGREIVHEATTGCSLRVVAGPVVGTDSVWVHWMEVGAQVEAAEVAKLEDRAQLETEFALALQHELGNALVCVSSAHEILGNNHMPSADLVRRLGVDLDRLQETQRLLGFLTADTGEGAEIINTEVIIREIRTRFPKLTIVAPDPTPSVFGQRQLLVECLSSILRAVQHPDAEGNTRVTLEVRKIGGEDTEIALFFIRRLEQIPDGLKGGSEALHAELRVLVAREVLIRHGGTIEIGHGIQGVEVHISLRRTPVLSSPAVADAQSLTVEATR